MGKYICLSLFFCEEWSHRNHEYLLGALANIQERDKHFPEYTLEYYIDQNLSDLAVVKYISLQKSVSIIWKTYIDFATSVQWRYERLHKDHEKDDIILFRDVDSVLTALDAKIVNEWLQESNYPILTYKEYKMKYLCAGGGLSINYNIMNHTLKPTDEDEKNNRDSRALDEKMIHDFLLPIKDQCKTHLVRSDNLGRYYLFEQAKDKIPNTFFPLLESFDFFHSFIDGSIVKYQQHPELLKWPLDEQIEQSCKIYFKSSLFVWI